MIDLTEIAREITIDDCCQEALFDYKDFNNYLEEHYPTINEKALWYLHCYVNRGDKKGAKQLVDRIFQANKFTREFNELHNTKVKLSFYE